MLFKSGHFLSLLWNTKIKQLSRIRPLTYFRQVFNIDIVLGSCKTGKNEVLSENSLVTEVKPLSRSLTYT